MHRRSSRTRGHGWLSTIMQIALIVWMAAAAWAQPSPEEGVDLRPRWKTGQSCRYEIWAQRQRHTTVNMGGQSRQIDVLMETLGQVSWRVEEVRSDGSARCTMTLEWLKVTITGPDGQQQVNDSRQGQGDNEAIHQLIRAMAGVPIGVSVAPDGTIQAVSGTDAIRQRVQIEATAPEDLDFIETATDLAALPAAPADARAGQRWSARFKWTHEVGFLHHDVSYTLAGVETVEGVPIADVTSQSKLRLEVDRSQIPADAPPIDVKLLEGSASSQVMFDLIRHEAVGRNSTQQTAIETVVRLPNQTLQQRIEETIRSQALRIAEQ